jgi:hypothetical protein
MFTINQMMANKITYININHTTPEYQKDRISFAKWRHEISMKWINCRKTILSLSVYSHQRIQFWLVWICLIVQNSSKKQENICPINTNYRHNIINMHLLNYKLKHTITEIDILQETIMIYYINKFSPFWQWTQTLGLANCSINPLGKYV